MGKYLFFRGLRGVISVMIVVAVVMVLIYGLLDRNLIFAKDSAYTHQKNNAKEVYKYQQWENFGYVDYVPFADYLARLLGAGEISQSDYDEAVKLGSSPLTKALMEKFTDQYEADGYTVTHLAAKRRGQKFQDGGEPRLFAHRDIPLATRLWRYLTGIVTVDNIHRAEGVENRGLAFTWFDPAYGGEKFSPAIMGNGTTHKYLLYFDDRFPFVHQNFITVNLGLSYSLNKGVDVYNTMTDAQGAREQRQMTYPTGLTDLTADDLHSAVHVPGSYEKGDAVVKAHFVDDYTGITTRRQGLSKLGYSFVIGILSVVLGYAIAIPAGIWMARRRGRLVDKLGSVYIVFVMAVPSLAYIFLLKAVGEKLGLPTGFDLEAPTFAMYLLPVVSLALPSAANLMKWLRRYMVDHMDAEYVRFARASGLGEGRIFRTHVLRNAAIPIIHGIPAGILGALVGAIITERVYVVPGGGNLLTDAINAYDNGVIVGVTLFYAVLSVVAVIAGDLLISVADPRIRLGEKGRA